MKPIKPYIAIIDYQMSNLYSVQHACDTLGIPAVITSEPGIVIQSRAVILPGVGAFGDAMKNLKKFNLIGAVREFIKSERKFMGVCLGMQLLFDRSSEFGLHKGLGILNGNVSQFSQENSDGRKIKVPQIGWNRIYKPKKTVWTHTPFEKMKNNSYMYFVHSYYVIPKGKDCILSQTTYEGIQYCSAVLCDNVFAVQFHPEKSDEKGIGIYKSWLHI